MHEMAEQIERSCGERLPLFFESRLTHTAASWAVVIAMLSIPEYISQALDPLPLLTPEPHEYTYQVLNGTLWYGISLRLSVTFLARGNAHPVQFHKRQKVLKSVSASPSLPRRDKT